MIRYIIHETNYRVINIDKLTYAGNLQSLESVNESPRYIFERFDICDSSKLNNVFKNQPDIVMHLAAESHVDRSIPEQYIYSN